MGTIKEIFSLSTIQLDNQQSIPLYKQLYESLRQAILSGHLKPGVRLPSIRDLTTMLKISRNTVTNALDQLVAEGYLEAKIGAGTFVSRHLPDDLLQVHTQPEAERSIPTAERRIARRSQLIAALPQTWIATDAPSPAFRYGLPALDHFPYDIWTRLAGRRYRHGPQKHFDFTLASAGFEPLRQSTAEYLQNSRGVRCQAEQVVITSGAQQSIFLAAQILLDPGDSVLMEEPGFQGAQRAFRAVGAALIPVPIDGQGFNIEQGKKLSAAARVAFVTPSRQHPTGRTMALARRLALIDWAQQMDGWIIEDDYDCEFNYVNRPLAALQGLDDHGRVIYIGTFSKVLFPALRLGYVIVPDDLVDAFMHLRSLLDTYTPTLNQIILADFMLQGHFTRHLRRMRQLYAERRDIFLNQARQHFSDLITFESAHAGLSVTGWLPPSIHDVTVYERVAQRGISVAPVSACYAGEVNRSGLVFGYAACDEATIKAGLKEVRAVLDDMKVKPGHF